MNEQSYIVDKYTIEQLNVVCRTGKKRLQFKNSKSFSIIVLLKRYSSIASVNMVHSIDSRDRLNIQTFTTMSTVEKFCIHCEDVFRTNFTPPLGKVHFTKVESSDVVYMNIKHMTTIVSYVRSYRNLRNKANELVFSIIKRKTTSSTTATLDDASLFTPTYFKSKPWWFWTAADWLYF
ncbi:hypothetical protein T07_10510 [Trichinella nelsoni]|uniref:Uncharacterized protein n=1 Tax=Trichinella nelsoni TaxID=6336 RepID=A0A0V0RYJ8_9BILA|nr:hypothetical protein T07_10510 [Trichinella nelsoni]